jgi:hypothetical protein
MTAARLQARLEKVEMAAATPRRMVCYVDDGDPLALSTGDPVVVMPRPCATARNGFWRAGREESMRADLVGRVQALEVAGEGDAAFLGVSIGRPRRPATNG